MSPARFASLVLLALAIFAGTAVRAGLRAAPVAPGRFVDVAGVLVVPLAPGRWWRASATAREVTQRLDDCVLHSARDRLALGCGAAPRVIAERADHAWRGGPLSQREAAALRDFVALDATFAVQGTSLVFGKTVYAACTLQCTQAQRCASARCADSIVTCAACLERAP